MRCGNCDKFIVRKAKIQKYCAPCNAIVARARSKDNRDKEREQRVQK